MTLTAGTRLGPYEILSHVAIKVLPESVAGDPDTLARFERAKSSSPARENRAAVLVSLAGPRS